MAEGFSEHFQVGHELGDRERAVTRRFTAAPLVVAVH
jgi:hypothetical protein